MKRCLKAVDWARILLVGRGFRDHGPPKPSIYRYKGNLAGWLLRAKAWSSSSSSQQPGPSVQTGTTHICQNIMEWVFRYFFTLYLLLGHRQPTCKYNFQPARWSGLFGWQTRLCSLWVPLYTQYVQPTSPHAADLGKQTYLLIGTAIRDVCRTFTLQGSN